MCPSCYFAEISMHSGKHSRRIALTVCQGRETRWPDGAMLNGGKAWCRRKKSRADKMAKENGLEATTYTAYRHC